MESFSNPLQKPEISQPAGPSPFPPKLPAEEPKSRSNIWLRSISSLALYLAIGYYFFNQNWTLVMILTAVVVFHELGHFLAMKFYNYTDLGIFFIPLVGAYASGKKKEVSQLQSSIILMAGPVPGIIVGLILYFLKPDFVYDSQLTSIIWILIYLNLLNLLPVYPLDGGQLLNRLFLDNSQVISKIFLIISIAALSWFALYGGPRPFYPLLIIPLFLLSRMIGDMQYDKLTKKIEAEGLDITKAYEDLSDEEYWNIRNILIRNHSALRDIPEAPPYEYSEKEHLVRNLIQNLLQRTIVQDISIPAKIAIIVVWAGCFAVPSLIKLPISLF